MTVKERILATLQGKPTDVIPFVPRLDIWYNANSKASTLPHPYEKATLQEITDELGLGYHAIVPTFKDFIDSDGDLDVGLGLYHLKNHPYRLRFHNIKRSYRRDASGKLCVEYETPKGKITTTVVHTEEMKKSGMTLYVIREHAIKSYEDYAAMAYILENAEVVPYYDDFAKFKDEFIGHRGVAVALSAMFAGAGHYLVKELMSIDTFYYEMIDRPDEMTAFVQAIKPFCNKLFNAALNSPAEIVLSGANYDTSITAPNMFEEYILPDLQEQSERLHSVGKYLATHTDGENTGLLPLYARAGFDIADSICPSPMTKISLEETRRVFENSNITIWGGIPSISVLESIMDDYTFEKLIDDTFSCIGAGNRMILAIADTVPPATKFERILHIAKKAREFGPVVSKN